MNEMYINHLAVFASAALCLVLGGVWYSPFLFHRAWMRESGITESDLARVVPLRTFGGAFLISLGMAYNLAFFLSDSGTNVRWGATAGFLAGFGWGALGIGLIAIFEQRSLRYVLINGGFVTIYLTLAGTLLGAWR